MRRSSTQFFRDLQSACCLYLLRFLLFLHLLLFLRFLPLLPASFSG